MTNSTQEVWESGAGPVAAVRLLLATAAVLAAFLAGIAIGIKASDETVATSRANSTQASPRVLRASSPPAPVGIDAYTVYVVRTAAEKQFLVNADLGRHGPLGLSGLDPSAIFVVGTEEAETGMRRSVIELDWIRREAGLPPVQVLDLRAPRALR
jgi:hypothetical protein